MGEPPTSMSKSSIDKNDAVAMGAIWNDRVKVEQQRAKEFEGNWGFLTAKANAEQVGNTTVAPPRKDCPPPNFEYRQMLKSGNVKKFHLCESVLKPQEKNAAPKVESHKYGWGKSLEIYGTADYGFKHVTHDWPAPSGKQLA